jgi:hypothetical protein
MKTTSRFLSIAILSITTLVLLSLKEPAFEPKDFVGAWSYGQPQNKKVMVVADNVFAVAQYDLPGKKLLHSYGGTWSINGNKVVKKMEWNSKDSSQVGREITEDIQISNGKLSIKQTNESWSRLDDGTPGALQGAWVITGNYSNDKVSKRPSPFYPRRTMKVLSGKNFHWIAYNVGTKTFMNAGGGTYTTNNGKYTENIEFFTKTPESVGKSLTFDYSFVDGDWRHRGEKSTGGPLDECWAKRATLEKSAF